MELSISSTSDLEPILSSNDLLINLTLKNSFFFLIGVKLFEIFRFALFIF
jgi:hypothetical protein